nr:hypothetical protein [Gemmatimonadota bacterium]
MPCDGTVATLELEARGSATLERIQDGLLVDVTALQACGQAAFPAPQEVA